MLSDPWVVAGNCNKRYKTDIILGSSFPIPAILSNAEVNHMIFESHDILSVSFLTRRLNGIEYDVGRPSVDYRLICFNKLVVILILVKLTSVDPAGLNPCFGRGVHFNKHVIFLFLSLNTGTIKL